MKHKITKEEWKKISLEEFEVEIPEEPIYFWHNGIRTAYSVVPIWTTWNQEHYSKPEEIYELQVVSVNPTFKKIEAFIIRISSLSEILSRKDAEANKVRRLVDNILFTPNDERRTKEQFMTDFESVKNGIQSFLGA